MSAHVTIFGLGRPAHDASRLDISGLEGLCHSVCLKDNYYILPNIRSACFSFVFIDFFFFGHEKGTVEMLPT